MENPIVLAEDLPDSTIHDRLRRGDLVRLARGAYTTDVASDPTDVVRRWWQQIVGRRFRGAVVTDRSAKWAQPHDGWLFVASERDGRLDLPGLTVVSRKSPGPVAGDIAIGAGVHLASRARALFDNGVLCRGVLVPTIERCKVHRTQLPLPYRVDAADRESGQLRTTNVR